jgi:hypothetical protein
VIHIGGNGLKKLASNAPTATAFERLLVAACLHNVISVDIQRLASPFREAFTVTEGRAFKWKHSIAWLAGARTAQVANKFKMLHSHCGQWISAGVDTD